MDDLDEWVCVKEESLVTVSVRDGKRRGARKMKPKVLRMVDDMHTETFCLSVARLTGLSNFRAVDVLQKQWRATPNPDPVTAEIKYYMDHLTVKDALSAYERLSNAC